MLLQKSRQLTDLEVLQQGDLWVELAYSPHRTRNGTDRSPNPYGMLVGFLVEVQGDSSM